MFSSVLSADVRGITGVPILVETDVSDGLPGLIMVGYLASAVKESADRVRTALKNTGISIPPKKITCNTQCMTDGFCCEKCIVIYIQLKKFV